MMRNQRRSITSLCLALLAGSCSPGSSGSVETGTGGSIGTGGSDQPGSGGADQPGSGGAAGQSTGGASGDAGTPPGTGGSGGSRGSGGSSTGGTAGPTGTGGSGSGGVAGTGGAAQPATALVTSSASGYWKTATWTVVTSGSANVTVNDASVSQTWDGFGGAFNELGWSYLTTTDMQNQALQLLFGSDGCRFAWGRIPIGASDYATNRYSDDEVASGSTDTSLASFSTTRDKQRLIPYIKAAQAIKPDIRFWASPWTPPTWMKTGPYNPNTGKSNSPFDGGVMKSDDATMKAHAQYLVRWIQDFQQQAIKIEFVSPQNEPNYQQNYPSCHWDTATFVKYVGQYLGPALAAANLTTKVMDGTLSNPSGDADIGASVLRDATAKSYTGVIGVQWGMAAANQVSTLKNLAGGIPIWLSEHQCGGSPGSTAPAPNDLAYAQASWGYIRDAVKNGLTAYNAWNMVLDKVGRGIDDTRIWDQNALLIADSGQVTATPTYYVFRHFSQYVDPGAKVVATSGGDAVAFKNPDGSVVAVMYNSGGANNNYVVSIAGKLLQFAMPGTGWATVKYR